MEGITNYLFRSVYHRHFSGIDTYFTPFVTGTHLSKKEQRDILKENNPGMKVVVQVLSNQTDDFLSVAHIVSEEFGYDHINLNLLTFSIVNREIKKKGRRNFRINIFAPRVKCYF